MEVKNQRRIIKLKERLNDLNLDGFIILNSIDIFYLTGFEGHASGLLITHLHSILFTDFNYLQQAKNQISNMKIRCILSSLMEDIGSITFRMGIKNLGFDPEKISYSQYRQLKRIHRRMHLIPVSDLIAGMRQIKDREELAIIRENSKLAVKGLDIARKKIKPGLRENQLAAILDHELRLLGASAPAFSTIVLSGERTSMPHCSASDKKLRSGENLVIDFGMRRAGYCTDFSRTFFIERPGPKQREIYKIVLEAFTVACAFIKPGVRAKEVDRVARNIIDKAGYGDFFKHPLGHGVGMDLHELPTIDPYNTKIIEQGMVFSIEPGIYIPGWGGVRIEDLIEVKDDHAEALSGEKDFKMQLLE